VVRYLALACDYDGTVASGGMVSERTLAALARFKRSGRKLVLVTGREVESLRVSCPRGLELFDRVVAENGGLLLRSGETQLLGPPPPRAFVEAVRRERIVPLSVGRVIVASTEPHQGVLLEIIHRLGLELQLIFNKGAVMVLPAGVSKASGLEVALRELGLSPRNTVAVGDGENDHAMMERCEVGAVVANALPSLREKADLVLQSSDGDGVIELIDAILEDDLSSLEPKLGRHRIRLGARAEDGGESGAFAIPPAGQTILVSGSSATSKASALAGILERLVASGLQFCAIDPNGDREAIEGALLLGTASVAPAPDEVLEVLRRSFDSLVLNLRAVPEAEQPRFLERLWPGVLELRHSSARPHWVVLDEAHRLLPAGLAERCLPLGTALLLSLEPEQIARSALAEVSLVLSLGDAPEAAFERFRAALPGAARPAFWAAALAEGEALAWQRLGRGASPRPFVVRLDPPRREPRRTRPKHAEVALPIERSFFFRGPGGHLNLRCHNLLIFVDIACGVDDATWLHHLARGDYSRWFLEQIHDQVLAAEARAVERDARLSAVESREQIRAAVLRRYAP
jgi:hydroxymethylpyrimidine pyrophosphatase-like HAD family hydrolase